MEPAVGLWSFLKGELFGSRCVRCDKTGARVCETCAKSPLLISSLQDRPVLALGAHEGQLAERVRRLKYGDETHLAGPLGRALGAGFRALFSGAGGEAGREVCLLPVPLHPERLAERGYNQSALVANALGRRLGWPVEYDLLERIVSTTAQASLNETLRKRNLLSSFAARSTYAGLISIWLVDDVCTTGSTLTACADALVEKGHVVRGALTIALSKKRTESAHLDLRPRGLDFF